MKTLEEVIKALRCTDPEVDPETKCNDCPYKEFRISDLWYVGPSCLDVMFADARHYLKVLQKMQKAQPLEKSEWDELYNQPLTWDELKAMEGKPVWYEHEFWKGWIILGKVEQGVTCEMIPDREERWYIVKDGSAKAYRKER